MSEDRFTHLAGELVLFDEAKVHVFSPTVRFAVHLFEGIRAYWNSESPPRNSMFE